MRAPAAALIVSIACIGGAQAGAWTVKRHHWQMFSSVTESSAQVSFDAHGKPSLPTSFSKILVQNCLEYGVTNWLTVFATPDYVNARVQVYGAPKTTANNASFEGGARLLLLGGAGKLSLQGSYKTAGAFDLSVSANHQSGRQIELRLLYGASFKFIGADGFFDVQAAQRWIARPRPDETPIDLTAGLWLTKKTMIMLQSFNIVSAGDAVPPSYHYYRSHKIELSVVRKLSPHWSLQTGVFVSPAGQNALMERGIQISLWTQA